MKNCDLHTHSKFSDGTNSPAEIIDQAIKTGLSAVALTDHNTTSGLREFREAACGKCITAVPGIEISSDYNKRELHIVGLFIPEDKEKSISEFLIEINMRKIEEYERLEERLLSDGYIINLKEIKKSTPDGHINRAHIATALVNAGYAGSMKEAFDTFLVPDGKYYKEPKRYTAFEVIEFLRGIGACPVLAHPLLNLSPSELEEFLPEAKKHGLVGIETVYSTYTPEETEIATALAERYGLYKSGGSDYHGTRKAGISLGVGYGNLSVPYEFYENLKKAIL